MISVYRKITHQYPWIKLYSFIGLFLCVIYWYYSAHSLREPIDPLSFDSMDFIKEEIKGDPLNFRWAHATNSKSRLEDAMKDEVHGIEADVILENEGTQNQALVPIMAHPPVVESDLTLDKFLALTFAHEKSIIKLDFKSMRSVELSLQILSSKRDSITVPVWLNADILPGPGAVSAEAVPAELFLNKVRSDFSDFTLSLGWTTLSSSGQSYSWSHVNNMYQMIRSYLGKGQSLTFPVNAALLHGSVMPLKWLCERFDASITLFQSQPSDEVSLAELVYARSKFPKSRVYYDLQPETLESFRKIADDQDHLTLIHHTTDKYLYKSENWVLKVTDNDGSEMRISSDVVWLRGPDALLTSASLVSASNDLTIQGVITFLPQNTKIPYKSNLQIYLYGKDHLNGHPTGIRMSLNANGRMIITTDHVPDQKLYLDAEVGASTDQCYQFAIKLSDYELAFTARVPDANCHTLYVPSRSSDKIIQEQTITTKLDRRGLVSPYNIMLRNGKSDGYAILEQIDVQVTRHQIQLAN